MYAIGQEVEYTDPEVDPTSDDHEWYNGIITDIDDEDTFVLVEDNGLLSMVTNDEYREETAEAKEYDL